MTTPRTPMRSLKRRCQHDALQDSQGLKGSQTGSVTEQFNAGEIVELSDYLAGIVVPEGWAEPVASPEEESAEANQNKPLRPKTARARH